jgi:acetylornithine deacetylase/succinyl-diaminopimelate desuccinylase-like protein
MAGAVASYLAGHGITCEVEEIEPGRPQVSARIGSGRPDILLTSHLDTVAPVDWDTDPFRPERSGYRLQGLGACDDKGSLTAMLLAFARLARRPELPPGTITLVAMVGEEMFGVGSRHLVRSGCRPDAAVVGEPTELRLVRVECGNVRWRIHALGLAAHGSRPWEGDSAVYRMADVLRVLRDDVAPACHALTHPLTGSAAFNAGLIEGGSGINIVPDRCTLAVERRVLPGEDPLATMEIINALLRDRIGSDCLEFDSPIAVNYPLDTPEEAHVVRALARTLRDRGLNPKSTGVSFGSDANRLAAAGIPCVVFGPGSIRQAHTRGEWIDLRDVALAARILEDAIPRYLQESA